MLSFNWKGWKKPFPWSERSFSIFTGINKDPDHPRQRSLPYAFATNHANLALLHEHLGHWQQAYAHHQDALEAAKAYYGSHNREVARTYVNLGNFFRKKSPYQNSQRALQSFHKALQEVLPDFRDSSVHAYPPVSSLYPEPFIMTALIGKAEVIGTHSTDQKTVPVESLKEALQAYELGFTSIRKLRNEYREDNSREYLSGYTYPLYEAAIDLCWKLWEATGEQDYLDKAFTLSNAAKSTTFGWHSRTERPDWPDSQEYSDREANLKGVLTRHKQAMRKGPFRRKGCCCHSGQCPVLYPASGKIRGYPRNGIPSYHQLKVCRS